MCIELGIIVSLTALCRTSTALEAGGELQSIRSPGTEEEVFSSQNENGPTSTPFPVAIS